MTYPDPSSEVERDIFIKTSNLNFLSGVGDKVRSTSPISNMPCDIWETIRAEAISDILETHLDLPEKPEKFLLQIDAQTIMSKFVSSDVQKAWKTVAAITTTMLRMKKYANSLRGGASINKATSFLEQSVKKNGFLAGHIFSNATQMNAAWKKYKSIAHYTLPFYKMYSETGSALELNIFTLTGLKHFLILAGNLERNLLEFSPSHSEKSKLLKEEDLWTLPKIFAIQNLPVHVEEFSEDELAILKSYRIS